MPWSNVPTAAGPRPGASIALPSWIPLLAIAGIGLVVPMVFEFIGSRGVGVDGALVVLCIGLATLGLAARRPQLGWAGFVLLLVAALRLLWPLFAGRPEDPAEHMLRVSFGGLGLLAALGVLLQLVDGPRTRRLAAVLAGVALAVILSRVVVAFRDEPALDAGWPRATAFVAPLALALALLHPLLDELRSSLDRYRASAQLLSWLILGVCAVPLIGHAVDSTVLTRAFGASPMPIQSAILGAAAALLLGAASERRRDGWIAAVVVATFGLASLLDFAGFVPPAPMQGGWDPLLPDDGGVPTRRIIVAVGTVLLLAAAGVLAVRRANAWLLRMVWATGLLVLGASVVGVSSLVVGEVLGTRMAVLDPRLNIYGLLGLAGLGLVQFLAAVGRCDARIRRLEALPALAVATCLALTSVVWSLAMRQQADAITATSEVALDAMSRTLDDELDSRMRDFGRLAAQFGEDTVEAQADRMPRAGVALTSRYRTLARMTWVGDDGRVLAYAGPLAMHSGLGVPRETSDLLPLESRMLRSAHVLLSSSHGAADAAGPVPRTLALAFHAAGRQPGVLVALFMVPDDMLPVVVGSPVPGFGAHVVVDGADFGVVGAPRRPGADDPLARYVRTKVEPLFGMSVRLAVWPLPGTVERLRSRMPQVVAWAGALIAALVAVISVLGSAARERAHAAQRAQAAAEASRREVAQLLEGLPDAFVALDHDWRFFHANAAAEALVRRDAQRILGQELWSVVGDAARDFAPPLRRAMEQRTVERFEFHFAPLDVRLDIQAFPLPEGIGVVARDVTVAHRAFEDLRQREADLAQALDIADLVRFEMDASGRLQWSGAAARVLGRGLFDLPRTREDLGKVWHPEDAASLLPGLRERTDRGLGFEVEHRIVWPDGSVHWVHTVARPLVEGQGPALVATVQDITQRRLQQRAVLERDRFFEGSRDLFCILGRDGRFAQVNPALCRMVGQGREQLIGRDAADFGHPDDAEMRGSAFEAALAGRSRGDSVFRLRAADGGWRWVQWTSTLSPDGELYAVGHDVTERLAAESARERVLRDLEARNEELQQFAYIASHDLQEPLRKIQAFGDRLRSRFGEQIGDDGRDYLARMDSAAGRMSALIADLLDYSRVSTRGEHFVPVSLEDVLADVMGDLEERLLDSGGEVLHDPLPVIEADRTQMAQLLQNLVGNALKYRHPGRKPRVELRVERFRPQSVRGRPTPVEWLRLRVADNGIGFDNVHRERIFAPFQRLHGRSEFAGTGIGLAIVRKIVERHGGTVSAEGRDGEGAVFIVELPLRRRVGPEGAGDHDPGARLG
jgi:PAS domain S-box-containing protein